MNPRSLAGRGLLGIVFAEAALFYMLAGLFRKRSSNVYFASAAACAALWQFIGYWGQLDQAYYTMLYAVVGIVLLGVSRVVGLETVEVYSPDGHKNARLRGRGLPLLQINVSKRTQHEGQEKANFVLARKRRSFAKNPCGLVEIATAH